MRIDIYSEKKCKEKLLAEDAEYAGIKNGKLRFIETQYTKKYTYDTVYRFEIPNQDELRELIEDLIEMYNERETEV